MGNKINFNDTFAYKLIYVFGIDDGKHVGMLKVGDATVHTNKKIEELLPNCRELIESAEKRIDSYTRTAGIEYELLWTELAVTNKNKSFRDYKVHEVLLNSGIEKVYFDNKNKANEWFETGLDTVRNAIKAVKNDEKFLSSKQISKDKTPIIFRPEQKEAIEKTKKRFNTGNSMLWNAKMRFGKTLSALQVIKDLEIKKTIIVTHRPVVESGWREDFNKIFYDRDDYKFITKDKKGKTHLKKEKGKYVFFASLQDLRGAEQVGGNFDKNLEIFKIDWDLVIVDEAHEGTQTNLAKNVRTELVGKNTKLLLLSGTPFNLLDQFDEQEIYTWDYIMEQKAKEDWTKNHYLDSNPYEELPKMNIYTYYLNELFEEYDKTENDAFNFKEFFRVYKGNKKIDGKDIPNGKNIGDFVHEDDIVKFLNLLVDNKNNTNYPFSTEEYRNYFRHSLWVLPGVNEAKALSKLLKKHKVFKEFEIVNVAGDGDEEEEYNEALKKVQSVMTDKPEETYTITLTCGRLTTGVSVKPWTAVFMLAGSYSTSASSYLQTIFRVQTPANIGGRIKDQCYVFDFAPDRTLNMVADAVSLNTKAGNVDLSGKQEMGAFLNFCPVISIRDSQMIEYNVDNMLQQLKKAYAERVARNGFDDIKIYNDNLLRLDGIELEKFKDLQQIIGKTNQTKKVNQIVVNDNGFTKEEYEKIKEIEKKPKKERTPEEEEALKKKKEILKQKNTAISILRGISIRIPLMIYGADIDIKQDITPENFTDIVDDESWKEFMPKGVTKEKYKEFTKYYDRDIFINAGRSIRNKAYRADSLQITERVQKIAEIFSTFRNPDKETVLTPWRVVNMHLGDCIGGYNFFDEGNNTIELDKPRLVEDTIIGLFDSDKKILEINAKTGLYALYVAYSFYQNKIINRRQNVQEDNNNYWEEVLKNNIYVICKTRMAKSIVKRTLAGYKDYKLNIRDYENINYILKNYSDKFIEDILNPKFWKEEGDKMKFNCVVGNPPYQENDMGVRDENASINASASPLYDKFFINAKKITDRYISLIMPSRWMASGKGLADFRKMMLEDTSMIKLFDYPKDGMIFENVSIKGGICYFLWDRKYNDKCNITINYGNEITNDKRFLNEGNAGVFIRDKELIKIKLKVWKNTNLDTEIQSLSNIISSRKPYGFPTDAIQNPKKCGIINLYDKKDINLEDNKIELIGLLKNKRVQKYIDKKDIKINREDIYKYKVFIPYAYGNGIMGDIITEPIIAYPNQICTETFLVVGSFDSIKEAENLTKYLQTKFLRCLVSIYKNTQHGTNKVYQSVPIQDFTNKSDIDWSKKISEIDKKLYEKYKLSDDEIEYIENKIKV